MSFFDATIARIQPVPATVPGTCVKRENRHEGMKAGSFM